MNMSARHKLIVAALPLVLGACNLTPDYVRPGAPVPASWPSAVAGAAAGQTALEQTQWQEFITDQRLRQVVDTALENNRDLRVAALNIEKARAQYQIQRADLFPSINATGSGSIERQPASLSSSGRAGISRSYSAGLGFSSYELDFFGRIRSLKDEALETYLSTEASHRSAQVSLVAEVVNAWLTLAADREHLQTARDTLLSQQATYGLSKRRFEAGVDSELTLRQTQTSVESARADVASYSTLVANDENALNVVVGTTVAPELLPTGLQGLQPTLTTLAAGVSSEVLLNRPDVEAAEHTLRAANADIGSARAAFFPTISLTTSAGTASSQLDGLFKGGSGQWSFAPQISLPIFDAGRIAANLEVSKINRDIAVADYEKAIQTAFQEVSDALATRTNIHEELSARARLVEATQIAYTLADERFQKGVDSYLDVLDSQRTLYTAQQNFITTRLSMLSSDINLYKALGGGFERPDTPDDGPDKR